MIYANKKIMNTTNQAVQNGKIIANVKELEQKGLVRIEGNEVFLQPTLWKNQLLAVNWIKCLHLYCCLKLRFTEKDPLYFKDINTLATIGSHQHKKVKVLLSFTD
jgi:hypothetical protein